MPQNPHESGEHGAEPPYGTARSFGRHAMAAAGTPCVWRDRERQGTNESSARNAPGEAGQQIGGRVQIRERDGLDRAVHVAVGELDQTGRDTRAGDLKGVGVVRCRASERCYLERNLVRRRNFFESRSDPWIDVRATYNDRPLAKVDHAALALVYAWAVGRVGDVHRDGDVGIDPVRGGACSA